MVLLQALINQGNTLQDAVEIVKYMKSCVHDGEDPEEVLFEQGLEPDYVIELLDDL